MRGNEDWLKVDADRRCLDDIRAAVRASNAQARAVAMRDADFAATVQRVAA